MQRRDDERHTGAPLLLQLRTNPLGFQLDAPDGRRYFVHLSVTAAQSLVLALMQHSGVAGDLTPELKAAIRETAAQYATNDVDFLKSAGVANE